MPGEKRAKLREMVFPNSKSLIWTTETGKGWTNMPRTISLICTLIRHLSPKLDPSRVYFDLWCRNFEEGIIEIGNESDVATSCGYAGTRRVRSWQERVNALYELGFIRIAPIGSRKYGFILMHHPHLIVAHMRMRNANRLPDWWWSLFTNRLREIGDELPDVPEADSQELQG
jgi:hypothetical protein